MTPWQLRKAARAGGLTARIISDGSRDYFVEIARDNGAGVLRSRWTGAIRFKSLCQVRSFLTRRNVQDIRLLSRVADEEAGQPQASSWGFAELRLST